MTRHLTTLTVWSLFLLASEVGARPPYRKALVDLLELPASSRLNDCAVCHLPGKDEDRPHNTFGARLKAVRSELRKKGESTDITARLLAVADEDTDGDGVPNLLELLANTLPAEKGDKPTTEALTLARKRKVDLLASLKGYRWRPFERVERPTLPTLDNPSPVRNPIDVFLAAEQQKRGLTPRPEAPRPVLLRRVYLDLIGLPPTPEQLHDFLSDTRPDSYERVVDQLLDSPRYGERWGRHWMDVWRYSDWAGFGAQIRDSQPHIWHWRDWIIESLNADRPYDRMVQEMLAADELAPTDTSALRATGYLVRNYKLLSREKWLQDTVDHTAMAFLGVTLGCAKCHDHMYDPITMKEYYQVRAIFMPHQVRTDRLPGWPDITKNGLPRAYDANLDAKTFLLLRGDDRTPDKTPLEPGVPESLGGTFEPVPVTLPPGAYAPDQRAFVIRETMQAAELEITQAEEKLRQMGSKLLRGVPIEAHPLRLAQRIASLDFVHQEWTLAALDVDLAKANKTALDAVLRVEKLDRSLPHWASAAKETTKAQRQVAVLTARPALLAAQQTEKAAPAKRRPMLQKATQKAAQALAKAEKDWKAPESTAYTPRTVKTYPKTSTGRRLAFAKWITHRDNPLAARVAVNHMWIRHFGRGIVPGAFDFGKNALPASHPALLDWLAVEFMENGWSMKYLHRLMVTSAAYRRSSTPSPNNLTRDADNIYLWRFNPNRLEAEVVRDAIFHVANRLDGSMGGPDIPHTQGLTVPRRSLYFQHAQEKQMEFLQIFDVASVTECYVRKQAILPQQALAILNSDLVLEHARQVARELHARTGAEPAKFVQAAFERLLSRRPTGEELATCVEFLQTQATKPNRGEQRARENLVHVLFNHHEFVTLR